MAFPVSMASVRARSSTAAATSSAIRRSRRPRSRGATSRHAGKAAAAARTARSTSAGPERGTCATTVPRFAGVSTSKVRPSALSTHSPPTSIFSRVGLATALISGLHHIPIHVRAPVPVELPGVPHLAYEIEIEVGDEELLVFLRSLRHDLAARVREVARAVVVVRTELFLLSDTIDRPHPVAVRDGMGGLLDEPKVHRQPARGGRGNEDELRSVKAEHPRALGEVAVVADVHADLPYGGVEDRVAEVAGAEVELLPEAVDVRDVRLAVLAEVLAVGVDHSGGVVVDAGLVLFVHRDDQHHPVFLGKLLHELRRRTLGNLFRVAVVLDVLDLAEVRPVEELLQAHHLRALLGRVADVLHVPLDHRVFVTGPGALDERRLHLRHLVDSPLLERMARSALRAKTRSVELFSGTDAR